METKSLQRFAQWATIAAATYGTALLGVFTLRSLHAWRSAGEIQTWWPEFAESTGLATLFWGTLFCPVAIWGLDRTLLWKSIPQVAAASVFACALLGLNFGSLGVLAACAVPCLVLGWIRWQRNRLYGAPRHLSGYGERRVPPGGRQGSA